MRISTLLAVLFLLLSPALGAAQDLEGQPIAELVIVGLRNIHESVVVGQMESKPGTVYRQRVADADLVLLERLKVFSSLAMAATASDAGVRIEVTVAETLRVLPGVSIGLSDEAGTSIGPAVKVLSINGYPQEVSLAARWGGEELVELSETSAYRRTSPLWHSVKLAMRNRENGLDHFTEHSLDLDGRIGLRANAWWKNGLVLQWYRLDSAEPGITLNPENADRFFSFGGVSEVDTRNSWTTPTRGWLSSADAIWHMGDGDYVTVDLDIRRFQPITSRQTLVATALLTMQSGERGVDVPTYLDYAIGGANSVRGWDFASRRGKNQLVTSLEHRYTLVPTRGFRVKGVNLYGGIAFATFADLGSAWSDGAEFGSNTIAGGGIGLRLFVPFVDVIRLDLSFGNSSQFLVGINEKAVAQRNRVR